MPRQTKEIVLTVVLALVSLANIVFVGGPIATVVGVFGVIFFGGGALLLIFRPQGFRATQKAMPGRSQSHPVTSRTPTALGELNEADRLAAISYAAVFEQFGVLAEGVHDADWFLSGCAGVVSPGRSLTPDDVLLAVAEAPYSDPRVVASETAPNFEFLNFEWDIGEVKNQLDAVARLTAVDSETTTQLVDDSVLLRVGRHSATVDLSSVLSEGGGNRFYTTTCVALAELYRGNHTGFRLALVLVDFSGFVMRIREDSIDELNAELGLTHDDYNVIGWLDLPGNDLDGSSSVSFDDS